MQIELSENQKMIQSMVREFALKEIAPVAAEMNAKGEFPTEILRKMAAQGLLGIVAPQEYGGAGLDTVSYSIIIEEISRKCASTGVVTSVHNSLVTYPIMRYGNEEQKKRYLPILASGEKLGAFAGTEPNAGSDLGGMQTTAVPDGDHYVINGGKTFITSGGKAGVIIVFAVTNKAAGAKGISAFIVDSKTPGFKVGSIFELMGINSNHVAELFFEDMRVHKDDLLGGEGNGFKIALSALDSGRIGIASQALGIAQAAIDESVEYAKQRQQFGKPISSFQAIQFMLAEMETRTQAARLLVWNAACAKDRGGKFSSEAAMAKLFASQAAVDVTSMGVQIHGGYGYTKEYTVERLYRDARITKIYEGTDEVQKMVISRGML